MAIHELYIGGPANLNNPVGQAYPKPQFSTQVRSAPAGHLSSVMFGLTRDFHFDREREGGPSHLQYFEGKTLANNDRLGLVIIPAGSLLYAVHINVLGTAPGTVVTFSFRNPNSFATGNFNLNNRFSVALNAAGELINGSGTPFGNYYLAESGCCPTYFPVSNVLDMVVVSTPGTNEIAGTFTRDTRIRVTPVVIVPDLGGTIAPAP
jgi:hypothetical protein